MAPIILLAGVLLLLYGVATLAGGPVAASRRLREHSKVYAFACAVGGLVLVGTGLVLLLA